MFHENFMDYIKSFLFLIFFITMLQVLGKKVSHRDRFTLNLIYGYLAYSLIQMIGAVFVQLFKIDYIVYKIYMILFVMLCIYIMYEEWKNSYEKDDIRQIIKQHFSKYYLLYIISFGLLACALMMTNYLWVGNHQDDGWYLLKVAQAPYLGNQYDISYATGFHSDLGLARCLNTFELDYAFWSNLLGIFPSVFCKAAMAYFNYFLTLCGFMELIYYWKQEKKILPHICLYFLLTIFIFALPSETLANHHILTQQDGWHFSTAIWYGSGVIQSVGLLLLFIPMSHYKNVSITSVGVFGCISLVLMSKSSQALPLIVLCGVLYLLDLIWKNIKDKKIAMFMILMVFVLLALIPGIVSSYSDIQVFMSSATKTYFSSPLILGAIAVILFVTYILKDQKQLVHWNWALGFFHLLIFFPGINHLFLNTAIYTFVAGRAVTTLGFMSVVCAGIYAGLLFTQYRLKEIYLKSIYMGATACIFIVFTISHNVNIGLGNSVLLLKENPRLIPESTIELSEALSEIAQESDLIVLSDSWVTSSHNHAHAMATSLRIEANNIKVITAIHRFGDMDDNIVYKDFDLEKQMIFEDFVKYNHSKEKIGKLKELLKEYPVDIIVTGKKDAANSLQENFGCELLQTVSTENEIFTYYILAYHQGL